MLTVCFLYDTLSAHSSSNFWQKCRKEEKNMNTKYDAKTKQTIRLLIRKTNMSDEELAMWLQVEPRTIYRWKKGTSMPSYKNVWAIVRLCRGNGIQIDLDDIFPFFKQKRFWGFQNLYIIYLYLSNIFVRFFHRH